MIAGFPWFPGFSPAKGQITPNGLNRVSGGNEPGKPEKPVDSFRHAAAWSCAPRFRAAVADRSACWSRVLPSRRSIRGVEAHKVARQ